MKATLKQYLALLLLLLLAGLLAILPETPLRQPTLPTAQHGTTQQPG